MKLVKLSDKHYFETINGTWTGKSQKKVTFPILRNTNFRNDGTLNYDDVAEIEVDKSNVAKKSLIDNDILLEKSGGGPNTPVGRVALYKGNSNQYLFSNFCSRIRIINEELLPEFVFLYLFGVHISGKTEKLQSNTTNLRNLIGSKYFALDVPVYSIMEQKAFIENIQSKLAHVEAMRQAAVKQKHAAKVFQIAILREVFPWKAGELLPEGWQWESLNTVCHINSTVILKPENPDWFYIGSDSIESDTGNIIQKKSILEQKISGPVNVFKKNDILYSKIRPYLNKAALVNFKGYCSSDIYPLETFDNCDTKYLQLYLLSESFNDQIKNFYERALIPKINRGELFSTRIPLPIDKYEQIKVVKEIEIHASKSSHLGKQIDTQFVAIEDLPAAILREVFRF
jgi:type I restriction enzyme, S subunit